jgi:hypothetical protein
MTWAYRVVKENDLYTIREVIVPDDTVADDTGLLWTVDEVAPFGETRDELRQSVTMYIEDIVNNPVLVVKDDEVIGEEPPLTEVMDSEVVIL